MRSNYKAIGELVERVDIRNTDGSIDTLIGLSIEKCFIRSVANTIGTDLTKYKKIQKNQFAVSLMQVSRDEKIPVACLKEFDEAIMSPAYSIFQIIDENVLLPEYLDMWFKRSEFDREAAFIAVGGVRGSMPWEEFAKMKLPVPPIEKQRSIVKAYQTITDRIALKRKINEDWVASLSTVYKELFSDAETQYSKVPLQKICTKIGSGATPKGGKTAYIDEGISLIRSTNVFDFQFEYSDLAHINQIQADALSNVTVEPNDVLFNITGVSVARCCMVPDDVLPARVNQHVMIVRPVMLVDVAADGIHHMTADRAMNVVATIRSLAVGCPGVEPIVVQYDLSQIQFVGLCHSLFVRGEEHRNFFSAISIAINQRMILVFRHAVSHYRIGLSSRSRYLSFQNSIASS